MNQLNFFGGQVIDMNLGVEWPTNEKEIVNDEQSQRVILRLYGADNIFLLFSSSQNVDFPKPGEN